jgi:hypothetical protein
MAIKIGIVGKPNVGKSTFFNAATHGRAQVAEYPFTTINSNQGIMYVRSPCPCKEFKLKCTPRNSICSDGTRYVPLEVIDVAGLVPGAHEGKGLGNKFLDDLRQAEVLIHVIDASGSTDQEGKPVPIGTYDPLKDIKFLEEEIAYWMFGIIKKDWTRSSRRAESEGTKIEELIAHHLTGLGIKSIQIKQALHNLPLDLSKPSRWSEEELLQLTKEIRKVSKPLFLVLNKCDIAPDELIQKLSKLEGEVALPTSAEAEVALWNASQKGLIAYRPGDPSFKIMRSNELNEKQLHALDFIDTHVLKEYGSTGIQASIERIAFQVLKLVVVYPVEDENKLTDKENRVLPDTYLMPSGSTARDLAYKVHSDLGEHFIRAIDARTKRVIGADYRLKDRDIIKIVAGRT